MTNDQAVWPSFCLKVKDIDSSSPSGRARALSGRCMPDYALRESERGLYRFRIDYPDSNFQILFLFVCVLCVYPNAPRVVHL